jgi:PhnB protein
MQMVKAIPDGYSTVTPYLLVDGAADLLTFMKSAFGATQRGDVLQGPDGKIGHCEVDIGDSLIMLADAPDEPTKAMLHLYVEDCDATYQKALAAGAESVREPENQFYGDRTAGVRDRWGNQWYVATHVEDISEEEMMRRVRDQAQ